MRHVVFPLLAVVLLAAPAVAVNTPDNLLARVSPGIGFGDTMFSRDANGDVPVKVAIQQRGVGWRQQVVDAVLIARAANGTLLAEVPFTSTLTGTTTVTLPGIAFQPGRPATLCVMTAVSKLPSCASQAAARLYDAGLFTEADRVDDVAQPVFVA